MIRFLSTLAVILATLPSALATTVSASPASCTHINSTNNDWSNPGRATSSDNQYATVSVNNGQTSDYLRCSSYGFSIPIGAVINGITVKIERKSSHSNTADEAVRIVKGGAIGSTDLSQSGTYPTSDTVAAYGGASQLWGETWTASDINNSGFGAALRVRKTDNTGGSRTVSVDHIQIEVDYTDTTPPAVTAITRADPSPTSALSVRWNVSFSEAVTGVNAADFVLVKGGGFLLLAS